MAWAALVSPILSEHGTRRRGRDATLTLVLRAHVSADDKLRSPASPAGRRSHHGAIQCCRRGTNAVASKSLLAPIHPLPWTDPANSKHRATFRRTVQGELPLVQGPAAVEARPACKPDATTPAVAVLGRTKCRSRCRLRRVVRNGSDVGLRCAVVVMRRRALVTGSALAVPC